MTEPTTHILILITLHPLLQNYPRRFIDIRLSWEHPFVHLAQSQIAVSLLLYCHFVSHVKLLLVAGL
jgi:hypothetical protein